VGVTGGWVMRVVCGGGDGCSRWGGVSNSLSVCVANQLLFLYESCVLWMKGARGVLRCDG
jgi:hypothetical protein